MNFFGGGEAHRKVRDAKKNVTKSKEEKKLNN